MIISHKHRFVFFKTRKTAGTSLQLALAAQCAPDDVISPAKEDPDTYPEAVGRNHRVQLSEWTVRDFLKWPLRGRPRYHGHAPAEYVKNRTSDDVWSYFKFAVERNPWERYLSQYHWNTRSGGAYEGMTMAEHFAAVPTYRISNWDVYAIGDAPAVDAILRFESLNEELKMLCERLHLTEPIVMPRAKSGHRPATRLPMPDAIIEDIRRVCAREIDLLGYAP